MSKLLFVRSVWMEFANCRGLGPNIFFPAVGGNAKPARKICKQCAVQDPCLEYAMANKERQGVWGGKVERQFREIIASKYLSTDGHDE